MQHKKRMMICKNKRLSQDIVSVKQKDTMEKQTEKTDKNERTVEERMKKIFSRLKRGCELGEDSIEFLHKEGGKYPKEILKFQKYIIKQKNIFLEFHIVSLFDKLQLNCDLIVDNAVADFDFEEAMKNLKSLKKILSEKECEEIEKSFISICDFKLKREQEKQRLSDDLQK